ncbi:MAG: hypothetical protein ACLP9L_30130 [Thermoguttaceae bacterium]
MSINSDSFQRGFSDTNSTCGVTIFAARDMHAMEACLWGQLDAT